MSALKGEFPVFMEMYQKITIKKLKIKNNEY